MQGIKKRRKREYLGPENKRFTTYTIDSEAFDVFGPVIKLPNPRLNALRKKTWQNNVLIKDVKPYISSSLLKCIKKYGYFAFGFIEIFPDEDVCINVIIADNPSVKLLHIEQDCGEVLVYNDPKVPYIHIWYRLGGHYEVTGFDREPILNHDDKNEFECRFSRTGRLIVSESDPYGFQLVEKELEKRRESV